MRRMLVAWILVPLLAAGCNGGDGDDAGDPRQAPAPGPPAELPVPRTEVAGAAWDGRIVVVGGLTESGQASGRADVWDPDRNEWTRLPDLPIPLHHTAVVAREGRVWVIGGYTAFGGDAWVPVRAVYSLDALQEAWREEDVELRQLRGALAAAPLGVNGVLSAGGVDGEGRAQQSTESVCTTECLETTPGPDMLEHREHSAMVSDGDTIYAIAGRVGGADNNLASVEVLADPAGPWLQGPPLAHSRSGIGAAYVNGRFCVAGGEEPEGTIAEIECTRGRPGEGGWEVVARLEVPRHGLAVVALGDDLHVIGGGAEPGLTVSGAHEVIPIPPA